MLQGKTRVVPRLDILFRRFLHCTDSLGNLKPTVNLSCENMQHHKISLTWYNGPILFLFDYY